MVILTKLKTLLSNNRKNESFRLFTYIFTIEGKKAVQININILNLELLLKGFLSDSDVQELWSDIKEKFGKEVDEQELYKVFLFFIIITIVVYTLEKAKEDTLPINLIEDERGYALYTDPRKIGGKLDEKTFRKLVKKIWKYIHSKEFYEKYFK